MVIRAEIFFINSNCCACIIHVGIVRWGPVVDEILSRGRVMKQHAMELSSLLLRGRIIMITLHVTVCMHRTTRSWKDCTGRNFGPKNNFVFAKVISPKAMIGFSESAKCQIFKKV